MRHTGRALSIVMCMAVAIAAPVAASADDFDSTGVPRIVRAQEVHEGPVALPGAAKTLVVTYESTSVAGHPTPMTGSLLLPSTPPPPGGWPLVVWSHMTTGAADRCAPSTASYGDPELARMTSGDAIVTGLLDSGFAVARPDYEGIGGPGTLPYLIGSSLARSVVDIARAAQTYYPDIGTDVILAGHSEGAVASLWAAALPVEQWGGLSLRGVAALTPPTQMGTIVTRASGIPWAGPGIGDLVGLAALMINGASAVDEDFHTLTTEGGLSARASEAMAEIDTLCYGELASAQSIGALAPSELLGPRGEEALGRLAAITDANDVAHLSIDTHIPVRIDAAQFDAVAPLPVVVGLAESYRRAGNEVTFAHHPGGHTDVATRPGVAAQIVDWTRLAFDRHRPLPSPAPSTAKESQNSSYVSGS